MLALLLGQTTVGLGQTTVGLGQTTVEIASGLRNVFGYSFQGERYLQTQCRYVTLSGANGWVGSGLAFASIIKAGFSASII